MADSLSVNIFEYQERKKDPMGLVKAKVLPIRKYTYKDYVSWDDDFRCELINGIAYQMASPDEWHQWVSKYITRQLDVFFEGKTCETYQAPLDVRLFFQEDESDLTIVQPDIMVICDEAKIKNLGYCKGAPDFIIEIISPSSRDSDFGLKRFQYEKAGVKEYWIIERERIYKYCLEDNFYKETVYSLDIKLKVEVDAFNTCIIDFGQIAERYK